MKSLEELKNFFNTELTDDLKKVDAMRKKIVAKVVVLMVVIALLMVAALIGITTAMSGDDGGGYQIWGWYALIVVVFPAIGFVMYYDVTGDKRFHIIFKTRVIEQIVRFINPHFTYISHKFIPPNLFVDSKLFTDLPNKYKGDDYVFGDLGTTKIAFSEVHAKRKVKKGDGNKTEMRNIFDGIFFVAITNQKFSGTIILPKHQAFEPEKLGFKPGEYSEVLHPDPDFNQYFKVYTAEKDTIFNSFNTYREVFEDLVSYKKNHKDDIYVSFIGSNIYVAISHKKELFEPRLYSTLLDFKIIQEYYDVMYEPMIIFEKIGMVDSGKIAQNA
ncbi:MAG: DUF3137 domain-containing protein [Bacteroidetes bacterium]|nr:DUF3137 domain-containing protein [Bacteroidota bacterium]